MTNSEKELRQELRIICCPYSVVRTSLCLHKAAAIQPTRILAPANADSTNAMQEARSAENQAGQTGQSLMNKTAENLQA